jgi:rhamnosyltransferase
LFIDAVDYEYCYRIKNLKDLKTVVFTDILLQHKIGYVTRSKWGFKTDNYSAFRTYYIIRNHIIMWRMYPSNFPSSHKMVLVKTHILSRLAKVLLAEDDKWRKVKAILTGMGHGLTARISYQN